MTAPMADYRMKYRLFRLAMFAIFLVCGSGYFGVSTASADIYVATNGNDTTGSGSLASPYATISKALTAITGGGTIIVRDGTYTDRAGMLVNDHYSETIPSGSASAFTTIRAETPYGVRLKWTSGLNYYDAPVLISRAQYVHVDGFIYEMLNLGTPSYVVELNSSKLKMTRTIVKRNQVDAYGGWYLVGGSDILIEDAAGVGAARYGFIAAGPDSTSQRNIFRRCVGRMDFANTAQPKATFGVYGNNVTTDVQDYLFQNTIAIDGQRPSANGGEEKYGGYYNPKNATDIRYQGTIVLNEKVGHAGMFAQEWGTGISLSNVIVWDLPSDSSAWSVGIRANNASSIAADSITVGGVLQGGYLESVNTPTNSALGGTHTNLLNNTPGAVVMDRYGVSGTLWGDTGYDQLTSEPLWPWPYEDEIAAVFSEQLDSPSGYTPVSNTSARGFATGTSMDGSSQTLTKYIWEYLGNQIPSDIYGASDTTAPTVTSVSSSATNGTYNQGDVIDIDVTFSEAVTSTGNVTVTLETGTTDRTCTFTVSSSATGTCNYTVQAGDTSVDLTVSSIAGTVNDASNNPMTTPTTPTTNLAANKALVIDTLAPGTPSGLVVD